MLGGKIVIVFLSKPDRLWMLVSKVKRGKGEEDVVLYGG